MDVLARERAESRREEPVGIVRRRHVIYVEGYDPRGAVVYHHLFQRESARFQKQWPVDVTVAPIALESEDFARWQVEARTPRGQVATTYDFLRMERFIRADMAGPMTRHVLQGLPWLFDDFFSGTAFRIFRASWRFGVHLLVFKLVLLGSLAAAALAGLAAGWFATYVFGSPLLGIAVWLLIAPAVLLALEALAGRVLEIMHCWVTLRRFGRGRPTWIDQVIDVGARRLIAAAQANEADELVLVGHSTGSVIAMTVLARALELDPDLGRRGPRLVLLTLGAVMPAVALHPAAQRMRDIVKRVASEPALAWVDCQARKDIMNFSHLDPVAGIGVQVEGARDKPLIWLVRFRDMVSPEYYRRLRWSFFRMHFQYIMASERPSLYDYILLVTGPVSIPEWAARHDELSFAFIRNGATGGGTDASAGAASS
jgi:pimeloyl-ACP methyl ester carboxylesterase